MKNLLIRFWNSFRSTINSQKYPDLAGSCAGRIINSLTFIVIIFCLGLWIFAFVQLRDQLFSESISGNLLTNLTCLTFFGGLVIAIFIGAMAGNFLRRAFWKWLIKSKKRS